MSPLCFAGMYTSSVFIWMFEIFHLPSADKKKKCLVAMSWALSGQWLLTVCERRLKILMVASLSARLKKLKYQLVNFFVCAFTGLFHYTILARFTLVRFATARYHGISISITTGLPAWSCVFNWRHTSLLSMTQHSHFYCLFSFIS